VQKSVIIAAITATTIVSGGILAWGVSQSAKSAASSPSPSPSTAPAAPAKQVTALGRIEPAGKIVKLAAPLILDGDRVKELRIKEGDRATAGQVVAVLDSVDRLQAGVVQAQQQVALAQSKLAQVKAGAKTGEIQSQQATIARTRVQLAGDKTAQQQAIARIKAQWAGDKAAQQQAIARIRAQWAGDRTAQLAAVARLEVELTNARSEFDRYRQLSERGAISQSVLDSKKLAPASLSQQLAEQRAVLVRIDTTAGRQIDEGQAILTRINTTNTKQLAEQQAILARIDNTGREQLKENNANLSKIAEIRPVDIQAAQAEIQSAIATLDRARTELNQSYIRAPFSGQILKLHTRQGEKIGQNGIAEFAETNNTIAIAEVYQTDIDRVRIGQVATVSSPAFKGELQGRVSEIGLQVSRQNVFSNQPGENLDRRIIEVKIQLDPQDGKRVSGLSNLQVRALIKTVN
jgi:HlyD family secretion protein